MLVLLVCVIAVMAAEVIPSEQTSDAVFVGQVLSNGLVQSITNVFNAQHGLYIVDELYVAQIRIESLIKSDLPIPRRFRDEVLVYYYWNESQVCPRPARLGTWNRKKFYCNRGNVLGQTNVLILPAASHATAP